MYPVDIIDDYEDEQDEYQARVDSVACFQLTSDAGTERHLSADEVCDLLCDQVSEQFWDWCNNQPGSRQFKPNVRVVKARR